MARLPHGKFSVKQMEKATSSPGPAKASTTLLGNKSDINRRTRRQLMRAAYELRTRFPKSKADGHHGNVEPSLSKASDDSLPDDILGKYVHLSKKPALPAYSQMSYKDLILLLTVLMKRFPGKYDKRILHVIKDLKIDPDHIANSSVYAAFRDVGQFRKFIGLKIGIQVKLLRDLVQKVCFFMRPSKISSIESLCPIIKLLNCDLENRPIPLEFSNGQGGLLPTRKYSSECKLSTAVEECFQGDDLNIKKYRGGVFFTVLILRGGRLALFKGFPDFVGYSQSNANEDHPDVVVELKNTPIPLSFDSMELAQCLTSTLMLAALHQKGRGLPDRVIRGYLVGTGSVAAEVAVEDHTVAIKFLSRAQAE